VSFVQSKGLPPGVKHELLYTVPYECESQPIEQLWRTVKSRVGGLHTNSRGAKLLLEQTIDAFYGSTDSAPGVKRTQITPERCKKWIEKSIDVVSEWFTAFKKTCTDGLFQGMVPFSLTQGSSAAVSALKKKYMTKTTVTVDPFAESDDEDDVPDVDSSASAPAQAPAP
jgi:hypothetical protein